VVAAWAFVNRFSADILAANEEMQRLPQRGSGVAGRRAARLVNEFLDTGGLVPLHTGYGRVKGCRGTVNLSLLSAQVGVQDGIFRESYHGYDRETCLRVEACAEDPDRSHFGGLHTPTVQVEVAPGRPTPWIAEMGRGEVEHLISVLRGACYVITAALTGMRDSELQALAASARTTADGLPALRGVQFKGRDDEAGQARSWWAPRPVLRAVNVLASLSPNESRLFARSPSDSSVYDAGRDIARLIEFINADPQTRMGRGEGLGLEPVPASRQPINQMSLRRSFAVYASTHPSAELGLGIQLGHCALRMTSGYATDGQGAAVEQFNDERRKLAREQVLAVVRGNPVAGALRKELDRQQQALIAARPAQAEQILEQVGDRLHLGLLNDCMFDVAKAPDACHERPMLANHQCQAHACPNASWTSRHAPVLPSTSGGSTTTSTDPQDTSKSAGGWAKNVPPTPVSSINSPLTTRSRPDAEPEAQARQRHRDGQDQGGYRGDRPRPCRATDQAGDPAADGSQPRCGRQGIPSGRRRA
jgi:hypothetical protein